MPELSIRILDANGEKVRECHINGPAPKLEKGQVFSLQESLEDYSKRPESLEHVFGAAVAELRPKEYRSQNWDRAQYSYDLVIKATIWEDMLEARNLARRDVYRYEPIVHRPAPPEPPAAPEIPSAARMLWQFIRGVGWDLRRVGNSIELALSLEKIFLMPAEKR